MTTTRFTIVYEQNEYGAFSPLDAAKRVRQDIIKGAALCFTVTNEDNDEEFSVDLNEDDENAVILITSEM